jgi:hypothetical protein
MPTDWRSGCWRKRRDCCALIRRRVNVNLSAHQLGAFLHAHQTGVVDTQGFGHALLQLYPHYQGAGECH